MSEQVEQPTAPALGAVPGFVAREHALAAGTVLGGRYVVADRLGRGGMAEVYQARDEVLGRDVAVKVFHPSPADRDDDERHRAEMRLLARLSHPGLVMMLDAGTTELPGGEQQDFLVMELVRGPALSARLAEGPMSADETALLGVHVAEALAYIHDEGVVHRDVKPGNILLPPPDRAGVTTSWTKLTDFGIARVRADETATATQELLGTPSYLSPEQATGGRLTSASDVYGLGLVLVECLTAERAFPGDALASAVARLHRPVPLPERFGPRWAELIGAMTALDPLDRLTATAAAEELRALLRPGAVGVGPVVGDIGGAGVPVAGSVVATVTLPAVPAVPAVSGSAAARTAAPVGAATLPEHPSGPLPLGPLVPPAGAPGATRHRAEPPARRARRGAVAGATVLGVAAVLLGASVLAPDAPQAESTEPAATAEVDTGGTGPVVAQDPVAGEQPADGGGADAGTGQGSTTADGGTGTGTLVEPVVAPARATADGPADAGDAGAAEAPAGPVAGGPGAGTAGAGTAGPGADDATPDAPEPGDAGTVPPDAGVAGPAAHANERAHQNARDRAAKEPAAAG